jgi:tRNA pseudouridine55 synthase
MKDPCDGLLILDKPSGITSRYAVDRALRWFPRGTRMGHTGTLDPLATGVLALCLGSATRLTEYVQRMSKTYRAGVRLGARSDTDDADGTITTVSTAVPPDLEAITRRAAEFIGTIAQVPPAYSAAKVTGRRAYDLARGGEEVTLRPRPVQIYRIDVLSYAWPDLELAVHCGKGTYIRSLARDLGECLGCGGYVQALRRTRVGPFTAEAALSLDTDSATARGKLLPAELAVAELPRVELPPAAGRRLCQGQAVLLPDGINGEEVAVFAADTGALLAVAAVDEQRRTLRPAKVMAVAPRG